MLALGQNPECTFDFWPQQKEVAGNPPMSTATLAVQTSIHLQWQRRIKKLPKEQRQPAGNPQTKTVSTFHDQGQKDAIDSNFTWFLESNLTNAWDKIYLGPPSTVTKIPGPQHTRDWEIFRGALSPQLHCSCNLVSGLHYVHHRDRAPS